MTERTRQREGEREGNKNRRKGTREKKKNNEKKTEKQEEGPAYAISKHETAQVLIYRSVREAGNRECVYTGFRFPAAIKVRREEEKEEVAAGE